VATPSQPDKPGPDAAAVGNPNRVNQLKDLKVQVVKANGRPIRAWLMDNESKRQEGMMFLTEKDVADDQGMLFVFRDLQVTDGKRGFWMKNCPLALDIIYISPKKQVLNVGKGMPFREESVLPAGDYQYVLELKQGMAEKYGIKKGTVLELPALPTPTE
jgi:hypothetical protein